MYHVALTPDYAPCTALCSMQETLPEAMAEILKASRELEWEPWYLAIVLNAMSEAAQNLADGKTAKASWIEMGCEDDAFSIDIFTHEEARYVRHDGKRLLMPHGAVGFVADPLHEQWIYDEAEIGDWNNVLLPHVAYLQS